MLPVRDARSWPSCLVCTGLLPPAATLSQAAGEAAPPGHPWPHSGQSPLDHVPFLKQPGTCAMGLHAAAGGG